MMFSWQLLREQSAGTDCW